MQDTSIIFRKAVSTETESPILVLINTYMHCILIAKLNNPYIKKLTLSDSFTTLIIIFIWSLSFSVLTLFSSVVRYNFSFKKMAIYLTSLSYLDAFIFYPDAKKNLFDFIGITQASNILTGKERQFEINICLTESIPKTVLLDW